jgi:polyribonucleotide nucleotidyltransferase
MSLNKKKEFKFNFAGKEVTLETGRMAKQADGAVLVTCNGTQVLVTVCSSREVKDGQDFFPLTVEYQERFYAAGKFLGGFMKRETKPSTQETLNARLIDRPLRPLFPEGYMNDTVVVAQVLSYNEKGDPEVLAGLGAGAACTISDIPFAGPVGTCKVARIDGQFVLNPDRAEWEKSDMELAVSASADAILMVEGEAKELPEMELLKAINFAHENIKGFCEVVSKMQKEVGKAKRVFVPTTSNKTLFEKVEAKFGNEARTCLEVNDKLERQKSIKTLEHKIAEEIKANFASYALTESSKFSVEAFKVTDALMYKIMRKDILDKGKRIANRPVDKVRPIETETSVLIAPHGSSLFTRGETQVLATVTIGGSKGDQMSDRIVGLNYDKFYLHYNFPGYSVGEAKSKFSVGRRELGHGNLAERAVKAMLPDQTVFPYTMRVACEVLESNGSSSMGSVCSASMALMDAGVPMKAPVAGIAMGLIKEGEKYQILTDILGDEDHLGDMDFKVAGTTNGVTAIQMDIKITGINSEIIERSLKQAYEGRLHILGEMAKTISVGRPEFKEGVPRITSFKIATDQIGGLIGPGGKNIKGLQERFEVTMEVEEDGTVKVLGADQAKIEACINSAKLSLNGPAVGSEYEATVVTIKEYGAFVDIVPGVSGLVHVSEFSDERVNDVNDYVAEGDKVKVKVVEVDRMGRVKLSIKAIAPLTKKAKAGSGSHAHS